jgi:hypothetical protein
MFQDLASTFYDPAGLGGFGTQSLSPFEVSTNAVGTYDFGSLRTWGDTFSTASVGQSPGFSVSDTFTSLAKSGAAIFGAAAPVIFATDRAAAQAAAQPAAYGVGIGQGPLGAAGGFDMVTVGLVALAAFAAWRVLK